MSDIHEELGRAVLESAEEMFRAQKRMADSAIRQITFEQMHIEPDPESNSVAVLMKHLSNAMRSHHQPLPAPASAGYPGCCRGLLGTDGTAQDACE